MGERGHRKVKTLKSEDVGTFVGAEDRSAVTPGPLRCLRRWAWVGAALAEELRHSSPNSLLLSRYPGLCQVASLPREAKVNSGRWRGPGRDRCSFLRDLPGWLLREWGIQTDGGRGEVQRGRFQLAISKVSLKSALTAFVPRQLDVLPILVITPSQGLPALASLSTFEISCAFRETEKTKPLANFDIAL